MNYAGNEQLRAEVAALANAMCDLRTTLNTLENVYHYQHDALAARLAGQSLRRINALFSDAYHEMLVLDEAFQD